MQLTFLTRILLTCSVLAWLAGCAATMDMAHKGPVREDRTERRWAVIAAPVPPASPKEHPKPA